MKVIVEGIDRAGKSTLVKAVKNEFKLDGAFLGHQSVESQYSRFLSWYCQHDNIIFDRGHIAEHLYSQVFQRETPFHKNELKNLNQILDKDFIVVYASPCWDDVVERHKKEAKQLLKPIDFNSLKQVKELYQEWFKQNSYQSFYQYNSSSWKELQDLVEKIKADLNA